ncbi:phosphoribosyl-AMP cyclohydrolase [Patescibacteria group bacterium]|nr:phosphoribosyl-AMP cyclohydrolase [Patescibacteria group bacterium]
MIKIDFKKANALVPAVIQDAETAEVLMLAYMNTEAFEKTKTTDDVYFWSRSRKKLWLKGEISGDRLKVVEIFADCDGDALLIKVKLIGQAVCHTGQRTCFFNKI